MSIMGITSADPTGSAVELEFELLGRDCFFVDASAVADRRVSLEHSIVRDARLAAANIEGQGATCESLHESRNDLDFE